MQDSRVSGDDAEKNVEKCSENTGRRVATSSSNGRKWYEEKSKMVEWCKDEGKFVRKGIKKSNWPGFYTKQGLVILQMRICSI